MLLIKFFFFKSLSLRCNYFDFFKLNYSSFHLNLLFLTLLFKTAEIIRGT